MGKFERKLDREFRDWETLEDVDGAMRELKMIEAIQKQVRKEMRKNAKNA